MAFRDLQMPEMNRSPSIIKLHEFKDELEKKLFPDPSVQDVSWKTLYHAVTDCKILASKTTIWNLFLDVRRKELTETDDGKAAALKFKRNHMTTERMQFLCNMKESRQVLETKLVPRWTGDIIKPIFTRKLGQVNGGNCMMSLIILILTILLMTAAVFPMGDGIFDTFELCKVVVSIYAIGFLWYSCSLFGESWYPKTWGGLAINVIFMVISLTFCVLFCYVVTPSYYETNGCFRCPACSETEDKLCFEYNKFSESISSHWARVNTCFCALDEEMRSNEPIIPYGKAERYCGEDGDDCSCDAILRESPENWDASGEPQEYFKCVYYSPVGAPLYFWFGYLIIFCTAIICFATLACFICCYY